MSKLLNQFFKLKKENEEKIYLFKSGIFYIALKEDAIKLADIFHFKLTNLNEDVVKCGFPQNRLEYYSNELISKKISFEIVDLNYPKIDNYSDYLNNMKLKETIQSIMKIDMNNISFREAFEFLNTLQENLKQFYDVS